MTSGVRTRKLTITVTTDFYEGLVRSAGHRKIGAFIQKHQTPLESSNDNIEAGYRAMAADAEREKQAKEWCSALTGETVKDEAW